MALLGKRSSFNFYFIAIYTAAGILGLSLVVVAALFLNKLTSSYREYTDVLEPLEYNLRSINLELNEQAAHYQFYLTAGLEDSRSRSEHLLFNKIPERFDRLYALADQLGDVNLKISIDGLRGQITELQSIHKDLAYGAGQANAQLLEEQYLPALTKVTAGVRELSTRMFREYSQEFSNTITSLDSLKWYIFSAFVVLMGLFFILIRFTSQKLNRALKRVQEQVLTLSAGNLPETMAEQGNELDATIQSLNQLTANLQQVKSFSEQVGKGDFDTELIVFNNEGDLGSALGDMRKSLKEVSTEDKRRDWVNQGLARFLNIIRNNNAELEEFCYEVISNLIRYVDANQGGLFILENEGGDISLDLKASYAYNRRKFQERRIAPGQGLVGQAYLERDSIYLKEIPKDYVYVTSGLGEANPRTIYIQPLMVNEEIVGVLELATFHDFPPHVQEFIKKVSESVAAAVATAKNNERNRKILQASQQMAEQLRAQEEELRQNTEELLATQEEMERRMRELQAENEQLRTQKA